MRLAGRQIASDLNAASQTEIETMLHDLPGDEQHRLVQAMHAIEELLGTPHEQQAPYLLRAHQSGDMGWVVHRHGVYYSREFGWTDAFEGLVADIVARFIQHFDPERERCWIAERQGENVGSVFLVKQSENVAQLRLLFVEPSARGMGIGRRLVQERSGFARQAGYEEIVLWTVSLLRAARHLYDEEGYQLVDEQPHTDFGYEVTRQSWKLELT